MHIKVGSRLAAIVGVLGLSAVAFGIGPAQAQKKLLVIKGSDTMVNLSQAWAEAYMEKFPGAQISVTGGGTGTGIAGFLNGTCDIANASRPMTQSEIDRSKARGVLPTSTTCAMDGLAIAVNTANTIAKISIPELAKIYGGSVSDWSQAGGKGGKIVVLSRESSSGTYVFFRDEVLGGKNYRSDALLMPSTKAIQAEISRNAGAIGYGGEAYFRDKPGVKVIPVSAKEGGPAIAATDANVKSGKYPLARGLFMYTPGKPKGMAADFIKFCLSPDGQKLVTEVGYTPVK